MNEKRKLVSNALYLFLDWFLISVINFFFWALVGKFLNPSEYGIVTTSINLAIFISGASLLGLTAALSKLIPEYLAKNQESKVFSLVRFASKIIIISNLTIFLVLIFFRYQISSILKVPINSVYFISITIIILSLASLFGSIIYGYQEMAVFMLTDVIGTIARIVLTTTLFYFSLSYYAPLTGFMIGYLIISILRFFRVRIGEGNSLEKEKIFFNFALPAFISSLAMSVFYYSQYFLLSSIRTTEDTGIFSVAMIISGIILTIPNILTSALFPIVSSLSVHKHKEKKQKHLIEIIIRYILFVSIPLAVFLSIFSSQVVIIFSNEKYLAAKNLIPILAISNIFLGLGNLFSQSLYALGKAKVQRNIVLVSVSLYLILALILTKDFSYYGLSFSYLISLFLFMVLSFYFIKKKVKIKIPAKDIAKVVVASILSFSLFYLLIKITPYLILEIVLAIPIGFLYLLILVFIRFYNREDLKLVKFLAIKISYLKFLNRITSFLKKYI